MSDSPPVPPRAVGTGWVSGTLSVALASVGLFAVLCFHFPSYLTMPQAREAYNLPFIRALLHVILVAGFLFGLASFVLRQNKALGLIGMAIVLIAALLGGSRVQIEGDLKDDHYLGLDYGLLNLIVFSAVFIPLEKMFGRLDHGGVFRKGWGVDLTYFFVAALMVQITVFLTLKPAVALFWWAVIPGLQAAVKSQPYWLQFLEIMLIADLVQYWVHRTFHEVSWLWKFHAVHHSAEVMDWMAGNRLHVVDLAITRSLIYLPSFLLGFADPPMYAYIVFVAVQSVFIHANLNLDLGWLGYVIAGPRFHHWHHGCEKEAIDKNFAVHFPFIDMLFGTFHLPPGRWPAQYGVHNNDVPDSYLGQLAYPFLPSKKEPPPPTAAMPPPEGTPH